MGNPREISLTATPFPTPRTLVVIGSPDPPQTHRLQFVWAAECLGDSSDIIWLIEKTGYELCEVGLEFVARNAPAGGYSWITDEEDLVTHINQMPTQSIQQLILFSHGVPRLVCLRCGWGPTKPDYGLSISDIARISPYKFTPTATVVLNSCNGATRDRVIRSEVGEPDSPEEAVGTSTTEILAQRIQRPVGGWTGRTSYAAINRLHAAGGSGGAPEVRQSAITGLREFVHEGLSRLGGRWPLFLTDEPDGRRGLGADRWTAAARPGD